LNNAHDEYLNAIEDKAERNDAVSWFDYHDTIIFQFKQTVCNSAAVIVPKIAELFKLVIKA